MKKTKRPGIIVVTGPTASGKTRRAVELATAIGGETLSRDSTYRPVPPHTIGRSPRDDMSAMALLASRRNS